MRKSKEDKLIEQRMAVNETLAKMRRFSAELAEKRKLFTEKAKQAHLIGASAQENAAKVGLKQVIAQQRLAERMTLGFEITVGLKDVGEMSADFMKQMSDMTKQMSKLTSGVNFRGMESDFAEAVESAQMQTEKMSEILESMNIMTEAGFDSLDGVTDAEVDAIVDRAAAIGEDNVDRNIERDGKKITLLAGRREGQ